MFQRQVQNFTTNNINQSTHILYLSHWDHQGLPKFIFNLETLSEKQKGTTKITHQNWCITHNECIVCEQLMRNHHRINVRLTKNPINGHLPLTQRVFYSVLLLQKQKEAEIADPLAGNPQCLQKSHSKFHSQAPKTKQKKYRNT